MKGKRKLLRLLVSPAILVMMLITYMYLCLQRWVLFIRYGGEWITHSPSESRTIYDIYELLKSKNHDRTNKNES